MRFILPLIFTLMSIQSVYSKTYLFIGSDLPRILTKDNLGRTQGIGADVVKTIIKRMGHKVKIEMYPWKRALKVMEADQADALIGPFKTLERTKYMHFSEQPFYDSVIYFYKRADSTFEWDGDYFSLHDKVIGVTRGWSYGKSFDDYKDHLNTQTADSVKLNLLKLVHKRVDLFICDPWTAGMNISDLNFKKKVKEIYPPVMINKGYFGFSKRKELQGFVKEFNSHLNEMIKTGELEQIQERSNHLK